MDDDALATWRSFLNAHARVTRAIGRDLTAEGLPDLNWYDVLWALRRSPERRLRINALADEVAILSRTGLVRLVDRIEAAGLVRREPVAGDRRGVRVVLTADGRQRYDAAIARHRDVIEREFGQRLTSAQHQAIADALWSWWHDADKG